MSPASSSGPDKVTVDAEVLERLAGALEMIGTAFAADEVSDARALALVARFAAERESFGGMGFVRVVDQAQMRVARDYEVIRGLLGRGDAPRPLRMKRQKDNTVVVEDRVPDRAVQALVEAAGRQVPEVFDLTDGSYDRVVLRLSTIARGEPITRIELLAANGALVAFGPSLAPLA